MTDIYIRKHRNGPTGRIELHFKKEQMRFYDVDKAHRGWEGTTNNGLLSSLVHRFIGYAAQGARNV